MSYLVSEHMKGISVFRTHNPKVDERRLAAFAAARKISTMAPKRGIEVLANISWKEL